MRNVREILKLNYYLVCISNIKLIKSRGGNFITKRRSKRKFRERITIMNFKDF